MLMFMLQIIYYLLAVQCFWSFPPFQKSIECIYRERKVAINI